VVGLKIDRPHMIAILRTHGCFTGGNPATPNQT
jgi:hypothetical protein